MPVTHAPVFLKTKVDEFLSHCQARNLSPCTVKGYRGDLAAFVALAGGSESTIEQITRKFVRRIIVQQHERGAARATVLRKLASAKSFCKWLEEEGLVDSQLIESIRGPRRLQELPDVASEDDVKKLIEGTCTSPSPERDRLILELLYGSGIRVAELISIDLEDFRDEDVLLVKGKGRKERLVVVGEYARAALKAWLPLRRNLLRRTRIETPALLPSVGAHRSAERLDVRSVGRVIKSAAAASGLDPKEWHPHCLRHAAATHMGDHGAPIQAIATLLGHSKLATAQLYTRVSTQRMKLAFNAAHPHALSQP